MEKRIRFGDLVRNAGRPQTFALWNDPQKNAVLKQARKENRVLTVIQEPTSKRKDFGLIGFHSEPNATYLLFPRALPQAEGRVIGLNYALLDEPQVRDPVKPHEPKPATPAGWSQRPPRKPVADPKPTPILKPRPKPAEKEFTVHIRRTATLHTQVTVKAANRKLAIEQALASAKHQPFDLNNAVLRESVQASGA